MFPNMKTLIGGAAAVALMSGAAMADDMVYADFPITLKGYAGDKTTSESYTGQIARHVLHDSLKKLAGKGTGTADAALKETLTAFFAGKGDDRTIVAPVSKGAFVIAQTKVSDISKGKNIAGKTYKGAVTGMPNGMTGAELVTFWIDKASAAKGGVDTANGYNYPQLISKFILGAMAYNQAVDNYLDENLAADKKPNNKPYGDGARYTGKEHVWDEAFGYFGAPAHTLKLTAADIYAIAKQSEGSEKLADYNGDGKIDLYREMVFGPAYYAAGFDKSGKTNYLHGIVQAFLDGRKVITGAAGDALTDAQRDSLMAHARTIETLWQQVLAEAVFKYAGSVYKDLAAMKAVMDANGDLDKSLGNMVKHWGELKGFSLALQTGRTNLGDTAVRLNRLIGFGPVLPNNSQVVDIDRAGNYVKDESIGFDEYMLHMLKVQKLMVDSFGIKARNGDALADLGDLAGKLGNSNSAEND